jgi:hypothetical protein
MVLSEHHRWPVHFANPVVTLCLNQPLFPTGIPQIAPTPSKIQLLRTPIRFDSFFSTLRRWVTLFIIFSACPSSSMLAQWVGLLQQELNTYLGRGGIEILIVSCADSITGASDFTIFRKMSSVQHATGPLMWYLPFSFCGKAIVPSNWTNL